MGAEVKSGNGSEGSPPIKLTKKDYQSDQDVRWCPGCGDYAILAQVQKVFADLQIDRDKTVFVSGIGCSSRFPYYMNTYGLHGIHGRAPAIATGLKVSRPDLNVWVITGDGDALSIGGNHLIHVMRRNVDLKILLFNNRIYGLTKGQYSPTSEVGKRTPSTPFGVPDNPFNPLSVALGTGASFVARSVDTDIPHLQQIIKRAAAHHGTAFVEVFQNCNVFNDLTFINVTAKEVKDERQVVLEQGQPLLFGKDKQKGIRTNRDGVAEVVEVGDGPGQTPLSEIAVHDEARANPAYAFMLSQLDYPAYPVPVGVLRAVEVPSYDSVVQAQGEQARARAKSTSLEALWNQGDTWDAGTRS
ncbi:MAG TPA: 2-oxoacid:ferredoxin oxidoreductase subunit beta [Polyangiaceae bacterium]|jgi:2-oxoglutarate/2-oxoacid ferredoxin oxidoreductase subunit beta|nr:2-oxoacid:ferredoxin oxidoreductase subunit beta [Polyangiaceae bacterium]